MVGTSNRSGGDRSLGIDTFPQDGQPTRPKGRSVAFNAKWDELLKQLPSHALRKIDSHQISILTSLLVHSDELAELLENDIEDQKSRRLFIQTSQQVSRLSSLFGLSIADRQRIKIEPEAPEDDFKKWMNGVSS
jgi:hypothetical protein